MNLIESCNRVLGISRQSTLTIDKWKGLTVLCGTSGSGKNTLLAGVALHTTKEDNHVILNEVMLCDAGPLLHVAEYYSEVLGFDLEKVVEIIKDSPAKNIFIEQYLSETLDPMKQVEDMKRLSHIADVLNKNITICSHRRREKL